MKNPIIFIAGLTPGNAITTKPDREGTLVAVMDFDKWSSSSNKNESVIASGLGDENGIFQFEFDTSKPVPKNIRVHIRELGFHYLGFTAEVEPEGFFYAAKLEPDHNISEDFLRRSYPNSPRDSWNSEQEFLRAQKLVAEARAAFFNETTPDLNLTTSPATKAPRVFMSYAWENETHQEWVKKLADDLFRMGITVKADFYELHAGKSLVDFMGQLSNQDKVVLVATEKYRTRASSLTGGVGYEYSIMSNRLLEEQGSANIVPCLRSGRKQDSIPDPIGHILYVDFTDDEQYDNSLEDLVRAIYEQPKHSPPPLGAKPDFIM